MCCGVFAPVWAAFVTITVCSGLAVVCVVLALQPSWRRVVALCVATGTPVPSVSASLAYFDVYRRERLPANLTQAQRDFFGAHTYERTDRPGSFHAAWSE